MAANGCRTPDRPPDLAERTALERLLASLPDADAIPRESGELSFAEPWELRALGVAVGLYRGGLFPWKEFQEMLVSTIGEWASSTVDDRGEWSYYRHWLRALERLVVEHGLASPGEIDRRAVQCVEEAGHTRSQLKAGLLSVDHGDSSHQH
jgi:nitrile hydratase accessory protein